MKLNVLWTRESLKPISSKILRLKLLKHRLNSLSGAIQLSMVVQQICSKENDKLNVCVVLHGRTSQTTTNYQTIA